MEMMKEENEDEIEIHAQTKTILNQLFDRRVPQSNAGPSGQRHWGRNILHPIKREAIFIKSHER